MPATPADALQALVDAANTVDGLYASTKPNLGKLQLPAVVVGAPTPRFETYCDATRISDVSFPVSLIARLDDLVLESLLGFLPALVEALEGTDGVITSCVPISVDMGGGVTVGAYALTVEFPINA